MLVQAFEQELAKRYVDLSAKLRQAADFVVAHPFEVATRSLRSISSDIEIAPATFTRLAQALDYASYEELREEIRNSIGRNSRTLSDGVERIQTQHAGSGSSFANEHLSACIKNIETLRADIDEEKAGRVVTKLAAARKVFLFGALGSAGVAEYMAYAAAFITDNWQLASRTGASLGGGLLGLNSDDVLIVFTKEPHANQAIKAAEMAAASGCFVVVITDSHRCPALTYASAHFIVPTQSPHFFSSYAATIALVETIIGLLVVKIGAAAKDRIHNVEESNRRLEYLSDE
ncbi:MurR/RpiR family transcriptional regulator [Ahrensia marina]|uniref:Transcriptional regulator n=1 Tax=Ahrensia marina TaxID=1514904 RepID=A0A0M9GPV2_9HYPH|nr:MurR/RpiR family transcriptional regulator [Ahrensia marina]KPB02599.1 hypothetical protein SU32_02290 [Ahrensia marina]